MYDADKDVWINLHDRDVAGTFRWGGSKTLTEVNQGEPQTKIRKKYLTSPLYEFYELSHVYTKFYHQE